MVADASNNLDRSANQQRKVLNTTADSKNMVTDKENEPVNNDSQRKKSRTKRLGISGPALKKRN